MRSFTEYLTESKKTFDFKIRIANKKLDSDELDKLESFLKTYDLADISKPKSLPVQEYPLIFPQLGPVEVCELKVVLNYPCNYEQIKSLAVRSLNCDSIQVFVLPDGMGDEEFLDTLVKKEKNKEALLGSEDKAEKVDTEALHGQKGISSFLKSLEKATSDKFEVAGGKTPAAKTTNDAPQNNTSPIVGQKGKK